MAHPGFKPTPLDDSYGGFSAFLLALTTGPKVYITIGDSKIKYELPKDLLCEQSAYFKAMFDGKFKEGHEQVANMKEIDGVVSDEIFKMLIQWLYQGRVIFPANDTPEGHITKTIEFCRLADMCMMTGMENVMADYIREIILANQVPKYPVPKATRGEFESAIYVRDRNQNMNHVTSQHIKTSMKLPRSHAVRQMIANACLEGFMFYTDHPTIKDVGFKFQNEVNGLPEFTLSLLDAVKRITLMETEYYQKFVDPITKMSMEILPKRETEDSLW